MRQYGHDIATLINTILLSIVYVIGIGVTTIFSKIAGKHFLEMSTHKMTSYWIVLRAKKSSSDEHYRQF